MPSHYRLADITVRIPFGTTEPGRIALLQAAGIPVSLSGEVARGFLYERQPRRLGADSICRWFDTGDVAPAQDIPGMAAMSSMAPADRTSGARTA
ncbi:hypothetical protein [uncultured Variovorax sp.]|uniref:hypothetical protein n=1 Tax=uncultured Variovorax sp. TaxID=114708 RepID=UPI0025E65301|nr:hypothetical protein [uncultured Variovorax sp.]